MPLFRVLLPDQFGKIYLEHIPLVYKRVSVRIVKSDLEIVSPLVKKPVSKLDPKLLHISSRTVTRAALGELVSAR